MINSQNNHDWYFDFKNYAINHLGISSMQFNSWEKLQDTMYTNIMTSNTSSSLTRYVPEPNKLEVTMVDIFSRMMMDRVLWLVGPVNDRMSTVVSAQLLYLESLDSKSDIKVYIDSPGGSVKSGLSIIDVINYISPDVSTICTGMAASMGSLLLGCGVKGKRFMLPHSKVMLHQVSSGASGTLADIKISINEADKYNIELFKLLGDYCDKDPEIVKEDANRDFWLSSDEAIKYGLVDGLVMSSKK